MFIFDTSSFARSNADYSTILAPTFPIDASPTSIRGSVQGSRCFAQANHNATWHSWHRMMPMPLHTLQGAGCKAGRTLTPTAMPTDLASMHVQTYPY